MSLAFFPRRWSFTGVILIALTFVAGCGSSQPSRLKVFPVKGQITFGGQPLANAFVVLHPKGEENKQAPAARAVTDASGYFEVSTYDAHDGAPEGEYAVTVTYHELLQNGGSFEPGPNVLAAELSQPATTNIVVRVTTNPNQLDPIEVRR